MFGKKQELTKELENKLNHTQFELEGLKSRINRIHGHTQQILPLFETQIIAQSGMDKELTKVVSHAYDTIEEVDESTKVMEQLAMELTAMRGQLEDEEQDKKKLQENAHKQKEQLEAFVDGSRKMQEPVRTIQEVRESLTEDAQKMRSSLSQMLDYAKQMTVLSLNCAIEAGRMGESGRRFIEAAEEVRLLSSTYERAAQLSVQQLDGMEKRISHLQEHTEALVKSCRDSESCVSRISKSMSEQDEICNRAAERHYLEKTAAISDNLKKFSHNNETINSLSHQTLADIEHLGESFMSEQEARKDLETIVDQIVQCING